MNLYKDILEFKSSSGGSYVKLYNKFTNTLVETHVELYDYLKKCENNNNFDKIYEDLSDEQIQYLIDNSILVKGDEYQQKRYKKEPIETKYEIKEVYIHPTFLCNLRCEYCFQKRNLNGKNILSVDDWCAILKKLKLEGVERINFTGGEPLMYNGLENLIRYSKNIGFEVTLLTNGMLIDPNSDIYRVIDNVIVSLDSMNTNLRTGIDSELVMKNIMELNNLHKCKVIVRSVLTAGLEDQSLDVKRRVEKMGVQHISAMCIPYNYDEIHLIPDYIKYGLIDQEGLVSGCGAGDTIISIDPEGDVFPCQILMLPELKITNILKDDWLEEYKQSNINKVINSFNTYEDENCKKCNYHHICSGGCRGNSYLMHGSFKKRPEYLCDYYKECGRLWIENAE